MKRSALGFTMIELVIVILIGSILTSISVRAFSDVQSRFATRGAQQAFEAMNSRARAQAIEYGDFVKFRAEATGDSIWVEWGDSILESTSLHNEFNVDMEFSSGTDFTLCMNPRGWGETSCNSHTGLVGVLFTVGNDTASVRVLPLGQIIQ